MSHKTKKPIDDKKGGIFFQPQRRLERQYKEARGLSGNNASQKAQNLRSRLTKGNVRPIAIGGGASNNSNNNRNGNINLNGANSAKRANAEIVNFMAPKAGDQMFTLKRKSLDSQRAYAGHFTCTKEPLMYKSKMVSKRANDLRGYVDEVHYNKLLKTNVKEYKLNKMKYGTDEEKEQILNSKRTYWFEFKEGEPKPDKKANESNESSQKPKINGNDKNNQQGKEVRREFLGKPKIDDANYTHCIFEFNKDDNTVSVYPCLYMDFGLKNQLLARGEASSEMFERMAKKKLAEQQKHEKQQLSVFSQLGQLFGHDKPANGNNKSDNNDDPDGNMVVTKDPSTGKLIFLGPKDLRDKSKKYKDIYDKIKQNKKDYANGTKASKKISYLMNKDKLKTGGYRGTDAIMDSGVAGGMDDFNDLIHNQNSKRLRANKTRGALEELPDFDKDFSNDEGDEQGPKDTDVVDEDLEDNDLENQEFDEFDTQIDDVVDANANATNANENPNVLMKKQKKKKDKSGNDGDDEDESDSDFGGDSSDNEEFDKLEKLASQTESLVKKDFDVPLPPPKDENENENENENGEKKGDDKNNKDMNENEKKSKEKEDESEEENNGNNADWMQISDDEDDDNDDDTKMKQRNSSNNNKNNNSIVDKPITGKKRSRPNSLTKNNNGNNSNNNNNGNGDSMTRPDSKRARISSGNRQRPDSKSGGNNNNTNNNNEEDDISEQLMYEAAIKKAFSKLNKKSLSTNEIAATVTKMLTNKTFNKKAFVKAIAKVCQKDQKQGNATFWSLRG